MTMLRIIHDIVILITINTCISYPLSVSRSSIQSFHFLSLLYYDDDGYMYEHTQIRYRSNYSHERKTLTLTPSSRPHWMHFWLCATLVGLRGREAVAMGCLSSREAGVRVRGSLAWAVRSKSTTPTSLPVGMSYTRSLRTALRRNSQRFCWGIKE